MSEIKQQPMSPKKEWARLYVDKSDASLEAIELLRNSGYRVITFPVNGSIGPELKLGKRLYQSLEEIRKVIEE